MMSAGKPAVIPARGANHAHPSGAAPGGHRAPRSQPWGLSADICATWQSPACSPSVPGNTPSPARVCQHLPGKEWLLQGQVLNCGVRTAKKGFCFKSRIFLMFPRQRLWGVYSTAAIVILGTMQDAWEISAGTNWIFQTSYHFTFMKRQFAQLEGSSEFKGK